MPSRTSLEKCYRFSFSFLYQESKVFMTRNEASKNKTSSYIHTQHSWMRIDINEGKKKERERKGFEP